MRTDLRFLMRCLGLRGLFILGFGAVAVLGGCANTALPHSDPSITLRVQALLPVDALLLGEQHDNPDHQRIQHAVVQALASQGQLAAVLIEMAEQPHTTTTLVSTASEADVQTALRWNEKAWPWVRYAAPLMLAVRAGVPVWGANLPRAQMREAMGDTRLDTRLDAIALAAQNQAIREGHCNLLPEIQIAPMTRIQVARDIAMADTLSQAVSASNGKTVLLIAGSGHVDKTVGIPRHLAKGSRTSTVLLATPSHPADTRLPSGFDALWPTQATPEADYCVEFKARRGG